MSATLLNHLRTMMAFWSSRCNKRHLYGLKHARAVNRKRCRHARLRCLKWSSKVDGHKESQGRTELCTAAILWGHERWSLLYLSLMLSWPQHAHLAQKGMCPTGEAIFMLKLLFVKWHILRYVWLVSLEHSWFVGGQNTFTRQHVLQISHFQQADMTYRTAWPQAQHQEIFTLPRADACDHLHTQNPVCHPGEFRLHGSHPLASSLLCFSLSLVCLWSWIFLYSRSSMCCTAVTRSLALSLIRQRRSGPQWTLLL